MSSGVGALFREDKIKSTSGQVASRRRSPMRRSRFVPGCIVKVAPSAMKQTDRGRVKFVACLDLSFGPQTVEPLPGLGDRACDFFRITVTHQSLQCLPDGIVQ